MEEMNNVVANDSTNEATSDSSEKLTAGEKMVLGGLALGVGAAGYVVGTYIIAPICRKLMAIADAAGEERKANKRSKRKKSDSGVEYDEDGDYRETSDDND